jgi:hypothetical protein
VRRGVTEAARVGLGVLALFCVLCAFELHGFSLPAWHGVIDGSEPSEVLLGTARAIRSDDWVVLLPSIFSQAAHRPAFPVVNELFGTGQNMLSSYSMPVWHPVSLFRPQLWGYFAGNDFGLAWNWWSLALGIFYAAFLALRIVARGDSRLALCGAAFLVFAPFLQFWSLYYCAPVILFALLAFVGFAWLVAARRSWQIAGAALLVAWSGTALVLNLYVPYVLPLCWLLVFAAAGIVLREVRDSGGIASPAAKALALGAALAFAAGMTALWYRDAREGVEVLLRTSYPGERRVAGGALGLTRLFAHDLLPGLWLEDWSALGNISEGSGSLFLFPVAAAVLLWRTARRQVPVDPLCLALVAYLGMGAFWLLGGPHPLFGQLTLYDRVPENRSLVGMVVADVLLAIGVLGQRARADDAPPDRVFGGVLVAAWAAGIFLVGADLQELAKRQAPLAVGAATLLVGGAALGIVRGWRSTAILLAALHVGSTIWFNPLVRGGSDFLRHNGLAERVREIDRSSEGRSVWLVYHSAVYSDLLRANGVRSIGGFHFYPLPRLWQVLDPEGSRRGAWNRYANVVFQPAESPDELEIRPAATGMGVVVSIHPEHPALRELGVTHVLLNAPDSSRFDALPSLEAVARLRRGALYRIRDGAPRLP